jgi:hypothetical protein
MMARQLGCGQMPPRLFLHEFLKPREEIKDSIQARRVFEYECSPTLYTWHFTPMIAAHPTFISWWQEFHDHIFSEPVHSFYSGLMPDFQPTSEVTHLTSSDQTFFTTNHDLDLSLQNTVPAPRARTIAYNAVYPVSALGFKSPTLAQLMARYAIMDPILSSISADKRKGLSLIAPPAAKRKRTGKKVPVEVRFPLS